MGITYVSTDAAKVAINTNANALLRSLRTHSRLFPLRKLWGFQGVNQGVKENRRHARYYRHSSGINDMDLMLPRWITPS